MRVWGGLRGVLLVIATGVAIAAPGADALPAAPPASQPTAVLMHATEAFATPGSGARRAAFVRGSRPITGERTVLPVIDRMIAADGAAWLKVLLPGRPNGRAGWISAGAARAARTPWRLTIELSARRVTAFRDGRPVLSFSAVIGKPSTPTPRGRFFVEETVELDRTAVGAPYALALSARSNVLQEFAGGPGQIAIHGLGNVGGLLGSAASHGCVRLDARAITWLATRIGPGTPVSVRG